MDLYDIPLVRECIHYISTHVLGGKSQIHITQIILLLKISELVFKLLYRYSVYKEILSSIFFKRGVILAYNVGSALNIICHIFSKLLK